MKKIVLITGASGGIGSDIARIFAQKGYSVALHYNKNEKSANALLGLFLENGVDAKLFRADLSKEGQAKKLCDAVISEFGRIDVLVNNAGISLTKPFLDTSEKEGENVIAINLTSSMALSRYAAEDMLKRKSGSIVNISSVWGLCGASCEVYYSAAKAGLIGFTKALSKEMAPSGIRVNCVAAGVIDTKMNDNLSKEEKSALGEEIPLGRFGSGYDVAKAVYFLASSDADYITGETINVSGGFLI